MHVFVGRELKVDPLEQDTGELIWVEKIPIAEVWELVKVGKILDAKTLAALCLAQEQIT